MIDSDDQGQSTDHKIKSILKENGNSDKKIIFLI